METAEVELSRLQRQFRLLESERKAYSEEARAIILRQTNSIKSLRKESSYLAEEIRLLKSQIQDDKKSGPGGKKSQLMREQAGTISSPFAWY